MKLEHSLYYDVLILGAGASGLTCAITAGERGFSCAILDKSPIAGRKIRIAGGSKANVTNLNMNSKFYISENPSFCQKILNYYPPEKILTLLKKYSIPWEVRTHNQIFCTTQASLLVKNLVQHCQKVGVQLWFKQTISNISMYNEYFIIKTPHKTFHSPRLVIALGSQAWPTAGGSTYGLTLAKQWKHRIIPTRPILTSLILHPKSCLHNLAGISLPVDIHVSKNNHPPIHNYPLLFTHKGLSGPAALQASCFWKKEQTITIDFLPNLSLLKKIHTQKTPCAVINFIKRHLPQRLIQRLIPQDIQNQKITELSKTSQIYLANCIHKHIVIPLRTEGLKKAEVIAGGVDTREVHPHTLESLLQKRLYFSGEILDVTGMLGGYNLHWAWASGYAVGRALRNNLS